MPNETIKAAARENGVRLWQLADRLGINDGNLSRRLRKQLKPAAERHALKLIEEIKRDMEAQHTDPKQPTT